MILTIYLSSSVSLNEWKKEVKEYSFSEKVRIYDPLRDEDVKLEEKDQKWVVPRDLFELERSDILLCYLTNSPSRFSFGTPCECMEAFRKDKPIVVVTTSEDVKSHPWVKFLATKIFSTVREACDFIDENFNHNFEEVG